VSHRRPEPVAVVDYDPTWPDEFERLKSRVEAVLGDELVRVEHVGSTAVPGLAAKPVVDLYAVVGDMDRATEMLTMVGYVGEGELGVPGRRGFAWPPAETRHHLYVCLPGDEGLAAVVRFRDYMRANEDKALEYAELKRELAARHRDDREAYAEGKASFIEAILATPVGDQ
jgi:GrpB-like predicted nucleotidyltransferase (UPF0157 family)